MCLHVKGKTIESAMKVAKKAIPCYKILGRYLNANTYVTPYRDMLVPQEVIHDGVPLVPSTPFDAEDTRCCSGQWSHEKYRWIVERGMIHSFARQYDAEDDAMWLKQFVPYVGEYCIFRCEIPEGATYFSGKTEDNPCYASDKIVFKKAIRVIKRK